MGRGDIFFVAIIRVSYGRKRRGLFFSGFPRTPTVIPAHTRRNSRVHTPSFLRTCSPSFLRTHTVVLAYTRRRSRVHAPSFPRTRESRDIKTTVNPVPPDHPGSLSWKRRALFFSGFPRTPTVIPGISTVVLAYTRRHSRGRAPRHSCVHTPSFSRTRAVIPADAVIPAYIKTTVVLAYTRRHSRGRGNPET